MRPLALRNVLVATDLSDRMIVPLRTAAELAALAESRLHVVHAEEKPTSSSALADHMLAAGLPSEALERARVVTGPPGAIISQEAWRCEADIIVLGPHRADHANPLGSTADRVVRAGAAPCLIVPGPLHLPLGYVLVPVDVSEGARGILTVGLAWASALRRRGCDQSSATRMVALHVVPAEANRADGADALEKEVDLVRERLGRLAGVEVVEILERGEDPARLILGQAEAAPADLIVIGTRGLRAVGGALLGSVSSAVVRHATRPVLLVPPAVWLEHAQEPLP
ncbi:MAG TPA: universal stress protein [Longimicrobiales bacterium]|nr:universal stress protein [Longimicrobiales bacterium]